MREIVAAGEMEALCPERVWLETERALGEERPVVYFEVLRACGALAARVPGGGRRLFGVPQPEKWHPEIDTGVHTMQVLRGGRRAVARDRGALRRADARPGQGHHTERVLAAALGHEEARRAPARTPVRRGCGSRTAIASSRASSRGTTRACTASPSSGRAPCSSCSNSPTRSAAPERFERFLLACEADARGRGPDCVPAPIRRAAQSARIARRRREREARPGGARTRQGPVIAERMRAARIEAIRSLNQA